MTKVVALALAMATLTGCEVQTAWGTVTVNRGPDRTPGFEHHMDDRPTQSVSSIEVGR